MNRMPAHKYKPFPQIQLPERTWPSKTITKAPLWCSVDLRDGNQALAIPLSVENKLELFNLLVSMGFKQIEIGFPSASQIEFDFARMLIEKKLIPEDVTIQVLTQAREHLITRTFEALRGAKRAIVHVYNSTSEQQRRLVFRMSKQEIKDIAVKGVQLIKDEAKKYPDTEIICQYSPESFTGTELDYAVEVCEAVMQVWQPTREKKIILNLPATVELATPNLFADQVEWFCKHLKNRDHAIISIHAHNDRGTAVAASELALLAGADKVEGTLFGNGERTGNLDIVTLGMNLFSQGIDPNLDFHDINRIVETYEHCTNMTVHARHPYAGELVYTAFSGSHQDAINKGMKIYQDEKPQYWDVPYLPIDPSDVGRTFESVIRINSQSGKGGVAYIMEREYGFFLPKEMHPEFGKIIQAISEETGAVVPPQMILDAFEQTYFSNNNGLSMKSCGVHEQPTKGYDGDVCGSEVRATIVVAGAEREIVGTGNGPVDAFCQALKQELGLDFELVSYHEHALDQGSDSKAVAYIQIADKDKKRCFGAGIDTNISIASLKALVSALNRSGAVQRQIEHKKQ